MTLYIPYLIFIGISLLSIISALILRKVRNNEKPAGSHEKRIRNIILTLVGYYLIKLVFGWRLNWYVEAVLILILCIYFDYLIIVKKKYSHKLKDIYFTARLLLVGIPIVSFIIIFFIGALTLTFGFGLACFVFPKDRTYGEQQVYKNLYIYKSEECKNGFSFKKKFLCFEKEILTLGGDYSSYFVGNPSLNDKITGDIERQGDTIFISGQDSRINYRKYIRVLILKNNQLLIQVIRPLGHTSESEAIDVVQTEMIKI